MTRIEPKTRARLFPALLKYWRGKRGMSQLDLAVAAEVSSRHLSFLETGRSSPSREMVLRLCDTLEVPLRDQNELLGAAGFDVAFDEPSVDSGLSRPVALALDRMFAQHEPFPMVLMDRHYAVLRTNEGATRLLSTMIAEPAAIVGAPNVLRAVFDPRLARPFIVDWERCARALLSRLSRDALHRPHDAGLQALLSDLSGAPGVPPSWREPDFSHVSDPTFTIRLRRGDLQLSFLTTVTVFSAPQNVTLEELKIESYFPLDDETEAACRRLAGGPAACATASGT